MNDDPFRDPELAVTVDRVRSVLQTGGIRPEYSQWLRARLVAEAAARVAEDAAAPARPRLVPVPDVVTGPFPVPVPQTGGEPEPSTVVPLRGSRRRGRGRRIAAWVATGTTAAAASAAVVVGLVPSLVQQGPVLVRASSVLTGAVSADSAAPIRLTFDRSLDHASAESALRLSPATAVRTAWEGDTLVVSPVHGLAPNSAYLLTVDARTARTAAGAPLAADLQLGFGTAPAAGDGVGAAEGTATPVNLQRVSMTPASDDAEAVVTRSESLLVTGARRAGGSSLVRMQERGDAERTLGAATDAICVSRTGHSVAFVGRTATGSGIVFANAEGTTQRTVEAAVDQGSPLGWIDDEEVTFVSGGKIMATDRQGHKRVLWSQPVDAARQNLVVAPGGRYVYLGGNGTGRLIDLVAGTARPLNGLVAFTADGAAMVWIDVAGGSVRVHYGPSFGGPSTSAVLPVSSTDRISDLAISPEASRFVYSVTSGDRAELRFAALPSGATLGTSSKGVGQSPNFSPTGQFFTVLSGTAGSHRIEMVKVPKPAITAKETSAAKLTAARAVATAFATAQVSADAGAEAWLARSGLVLPAVPRMTRATLLSAFAADNGTVTARLRLTADPTASRTYPLQGEETLTIAPAGSTDTGQGLLPKVTSAVVGPFAAAPSGPQVLRVVVNSAGQVGLTFDSDLEPTSVQTGVRLIVAASGAALGGTSRYDAATRTAWATPTGAENGALVRVSLAGVRDLRGTAAPSTGPLEVRLG